MTAEPTTEPAAYLGSFHLSRDPHGVIHVQGTHVDVQAGSVPVALKLLADLAAHGRPVSAAIPVACGLPLAALPEGWTPLTAVASIKCLTGDGEVCYVERTSPDLTYVEALGMLTTHADTLRRNLTSG